MSELQDNEECKLAALEERVRWLRYQPLIEHIVFSQIDWSIPILKLRKEKCCLVIGSGCKGFIGNAAKKYRDHYNTRHHLQWEEDQRRKAMSTKQEVESPAPKIQLRPTIIAAFYTVEMDLD